MNKPQLLAPETDFVPELPPQRPIGELLVAAAQLERTDVELVRQHQDAKGMRFGEAAVSLGLVSQEAMRAALATQYGFPSLHPLADNLSAELVCAVNPGHPAAAAIARIRAALLVARGGRSTPAVIAVTSPERGEGRTFLAANLALALSQTGAHTLLIDGDMRNGRLHRLFGASADAGLARVLIGRASIAELHRVAAHETLAFLPAGHAPNPQELLSGARFDSLMARLAAPRDFVIIDTPAWSCGADAQLITAAAGTALLLARMQTTTLHKLQDLHHALAQTGARLMAVPVGQ